LAPQKSLKEELRAIRETVSESLEDILDETENEMNLKLDGLDRHHAMEEVTKCQQQNVEIQSVDITNLTNLILLNCHLTPAMCT
jgi:hypothetical protein